MPILEALKSLLGGSWDLVSKARSSPSGVRRIIRNYDRMYNSSVTKSHDPPSKAVFLQHILNSTLKLPTAVGFQGLGLRRPETPTHVQVP